MDQTVDVLLDRLFEASLRLEQAVIKEESEPDDWLAILDEREEIVLQFQGSGITGFMLTAAQREQLGKINELNQRLIPLMDERKQGVQKQLNNVQRSKQAMHSYNDEGPSGYGAFFDRKN
ncbi:flagellar protein FliT [Brevibacillus panacihumi]|uniref:Flagellar protein FliT n=1 Tax=Brevibacillus panacihumi TaxID=497735 RepID=A0A3M8DB10_9BACL|nr:flagellar protein FliT [Brevibacillus panacihumi]RNB85232.1 flagellar protein FliT [Brevibacillus panacihumi]